MDETIKAVADQTHHVRSMEYVELQREHVLQEVLHDSPNDSVEEILPGHVSERMDERIQAVADRYSVLYQHVLLLLLDSV